jgi:lipoate-protein ligase A
MNSYCRLLPTESLDGASNMAADEVMLQSADRGIASLRFYTWSEPTLTLGYFQAAALRLAEPLLAHAAWVRRPSGGAAIMHDLELTYCLALPSGSPWQSRESWVCRFHHVVALALEKFSVSTRPVVCGEEKKLGDFLCFLHQTPGDLLVGPAKIVGSAQRKLRGALMQHGSILLAQSPLTPSLPGISELTGRQIAIADLSGQILSQLRSNTGWQIEPDNWAAEDMNQKADCAREKYGTSAWNGKR